MQSWDQLGLGENNSLDCVNKKLCKANYFKNSKQADFNDETVDFLKQPVKQKGLLLKTWDSILKGMYTSHMFAHAEVDVFLYAPE